MNIVRSSEMNTSRWAGGTTTELAIGPEGSDYASRQFGWRLSTATVNPWESTFSVLPGIHRVLMVISGELTLKIEAEEISQTLVAFEQICFEGDQEVVGSCSEPVIDFNLMLADGYMGQLESVDIATQATLANIGDYLYVYVVEGSLTQPLLFAGDLGMTQEATLHLEGDAKVVVAYVIGAE